MGAAVLHVPHQIPRAAGAAVRLRLALRRAPRPTRRPPPLPQFSGQTKPVACGLLTSGWPRCSVCMVTCSGTSCYSCWHCLADAYGCYKECQGPACSDDQPCCDPVSLGRAYEPRQFCSKQLGRCIVHPCDDGGKRPNPDCTDTQRCVVLPDETAACQAREPAAGGRGGLWGWPVPRPEVGGQWSSRRPARPTDARAELHAPRPAAVPKCTTTADCKAEPGEPNLLCYQGQCKVHPCWVKAGTTPRCTTPNTTCQVNMTTGGYVCAPGERRCRAEEPTTSHSSPATRPAVVRCSALPHVPPPALTPARPPACLQWGSSTAATPSAAPTKSASACRAP